MALHGINHLAFITEDLRTTIRFYRDLLGLRLDSGIGHDGYRHYFFKLGDEATQIAFFEYQGATAMERKFPGTRTDKPLGFDHVALSIDSKEELFALKDKLEAAGVSVHGAVDHGVFWSIYFFDPNNIPLEASWQFMEILQPPAMSEDSPMDIVKEGALPQPGVWPAPTRKTPPEEMVASSGNGKPMRTAFLRQGSARYRAGQAPVE